MIPWSFQPASLIYWSLAWRSASLRSPSAQGAAPALPPPAAHLLCAQLFFVSFSPYFTHCNFNTFRSQSIFKFTHPFTISVVFSCIFDFPYGIIFLLPEEYHLVFSFGLDFLVSILPILVCIKILYNFYSWRTFSLGITFPISTLKWSFLVFWFLFLIHQLLG